MIRYSPDSTGFGCVFVYGLFQWLGGLFESIILVQQVGIEGLGCSWYLFLCRVDDHL